MNLTQIDSLIQTKDILKIREAIDLASSCKASIIEDYLNLFNWFINVNHIDDYILGRWINKKEKEEKILAILSIDELFIGTSGYLVLPNNFHLFSNLKSLKIASKNIYFDGHITFPQTLVEVELYDYEGFLLGLYECKNIRKLVISAFDSSILHQVFSMFKELESLELINPKIKEIPNNILELRQLRYFSVGNPVFDIRSTNYQAILNFCTLIIPALTNLKSLIIHHVDLSSCELTLDSYKNIEVLRVLGCNLKYLPKSILGFKKLKKLDFSYNYTIEVPDWLHELNDSIEIEQEI